MKCPLSRHALAHAVALDTANRRMRAEGRTKWNREDYDAAAVAYNKVYPIEKAKREACNKG